MLGRAIFFISTLIFSIITCNISASEPIVIEKGSSSYSIGSHLEILEDKEKKWTIKDIVSDEMSEKFVKSTNKSPSFGFTNSAYWVRFNIKSNLRNNETWLLELDYPLMDWIKLYLAMDDGDFIVRKTGYRLPFSQRDVKHRNFVFKLDIPAGKTKTYYLRFENEDRMEIPLTLWSTQAFQEKDHIEQYILGMYYGILFIMFIYNFILFFYIRDKSYLYYILFILSYAFYQLTQNGLAFEYFWPNFLSTHYIPLIDSLLLIAIIQFTQSFLQTKSNAIVIHKILTTLKFTFIIPIIIPLFSFYFKNKQFNSYSVSIVIVIALIIITIFAVLSAGAVSFFRKYRPAKYFMFAWFIFIIGALIYALKVVAILPNNYVTSYSIQAGSVILVILFSLGLGDRISIMRQEKQAIEKELIEAQIREVDIIKKTTEELQELNKTLMVSERKYKYIVESANDLIFTMSADFTILTVNKAVWIHLKVNPEKLIAKNFMDFVYEEGIKKEESVSRQMVQDKLKYLVEKKEPVSFNVDFGSSTMLEPREMNIKLEYIDVSGKDEIIGKGVSVIDDTLLRFFNYEKQSYSINNNLFMAEEVTHRLTKNLRKYLDWKEVNHTRIALREMLINAIEHGNLNITFQEKTDAIMNDNYYEFISKRQRDPKNSEKRVHIECLIDHEKVVYKITDEGYGFDYKKALNTDIDELNKEMIPHGRGLKMARAAFDLIQYNKKGNQVLLVKWYQKENIRKIIKGKYTSTH